MPDSVTTTSTFLDGVLLVANGISDLAVILDSPPCGDFKFRKVGIRQDLFSTLNPPGRVARPHCTGVRSAQMTLGSEEALLSAARRVDSLLSPGAFMVTATSPVQVTGEYHELATRRLTQELGKPVFSFPSKALSGDALDGIEAALLAAVGALPLAPGKTVAGHVAIVGMPFDRNECDCLANLSELQRLISALGLHCCCVLPSGQTFQQCAQLESAQWILALPYGRDAAQRAGQLLGIPVLQTQLPVGLDGTSQWLRSVGSFTQRDAQAESLIQSELQRCVPLLRRMVRSLLVNRRFLLAADPYLAAALVPALAEFGVDFPDILLRTRDTVRVAQAAKTILSAVPLAQIHFDSTVLELEQRWKAQLLTGIDLAIGSTLERAALVDSDIPYLELGFPSYVRHALFDAPWMGYEGTLWIADRLYNLLSERRYQG